MSIGLVSPTTWFNGQVVSPAWMQGVTDNVNGWVAGTNSMSSLVVDGTGGLTVAPAAGSITASGNISASGTLTSSTGTSKSIMVLGSDWNPNGGSDWTMTSNLIGWRTIATGGTNIEGIIRLPYASSTTTITRVDFYLNKPNTTSTSVRLYTTDPSGFFGAQTQIAIQSSTTAGNQVISFTGLSQTLSDSLQMFINYAPSAATNELIVGAKVTYTSKVF